MALVASFDDPEPLSNCYLHHCVLPCCREDRARGSFVSIHRDGIYSKFHIGSIVLLLVLINALLFLKMLFCDAMGDEDPTVILALVSLKMLKMHQGMCIIDCLVVLSVFSRFWSHCTFNSYLWLMWIYVAYSAMRFWECSMRFWVFNKK